MNKFTDFKKAVHDQFNRLSEHNLFTVNIGKDDIWDTYLNSFPEGTNPIYRERTEHDCQCCKQFIRACGGAVTIVDNKLVSIWDIEIDGFYQEVADAMSAYVKSLSICDVYLHYEATLGTDYNHQQAESGEVIKWQHFYFKLPAKFVNKNNIDAVRGDLRSNKDVLKRSLEDLTVESAETVLELIDQGSLYRGEEHKAIVAMFTINKVAFDLITDEERDNFCWDLSITLGGASKIRNSVIGTLLDDLSNDIELDKAVKSFESKVAPENYKRPTALITQSMIKKAQEKVTDLGIENSLQRRYAVADDITINNVLFADREAKQAMGVFDELSNDVKVDVDKFDKVEEVHVDTFIEQILPKATKLELLVENNHSGNFMSLVAPVDADSPNILKWDNNFSWAYNGEVTDSIKEKVKQAGGNVEGALRCSLSWFNYDDLDIHVIEPGGNEIYYSNKFNGLTSGQLDVDMNASGQESRSAVENITWTNEARMQEGRYKVVINNYQLREKTDFGFIAEIEHDGVIHTFKYDKQIKNNGNVIVAEFDFTRASGIKFIRSLDSTETSKVVWGISTQKFHTVTMLMSSPNHWDSQKNGNKHWFFIVNECRNEEKARGFFNEFLKTELIEHSKVFEILGSKMKTEKSDHQLSGLGFSSTQRNSVLCKVTGSFSRTIKINF